MARPPFVLDAAQAFAAPGSRHRRRVAAPLSGVELPSAAVDPSTDVVVDVVLEAQGTTVVAEGTATATWTGECRRCLTRTSAQVEVEFREIYAEDPVEGETYPLVDQIVDLTPMLREALALALPLAPLCAEDCPGPAPEVHPVGPAGEGAEPDGDAGGSRNGSGDGDPAGDRWAVLDQLRLDDES